MDGSKSSSDELRRAQTSSEACPKGGPMEPARPLRYEQNFKSFISSSLFYFTFYFFTFYLRPQQDETIRNWTDRMERDEPQPMGRSCERTRAAWTKKHPWAGCIHWGMSSPKICGRKICERNNAMQKCVNFEWMKKVVDENMRERKNNQTKKWTNENMHERKNPQTKKYVYEK